jgi:hypothetical protein
MKAIVAFLGSLEDPVAKAGGKMPVPMCRVPEGYGVI